MTEPRFTGEARSVMPLTARDSEPRAVQLVVSVDWAQALTRLQQLQNQGCTLVRIFQDERGRVRVEPDS